MSSERTFSGIAALVAAISMFLLSNQCLAQGEQVLAEVGAMGSIANGNQGVVRPDFANKESGDYESWVSLASQRNFRAFAISARGTALVLDGNTLREYTASGAAKTNAGFPVDCTALSFTITKPNGSEASDSLSECGAFTPLNDGSIRIAGKTKGGGFVIIAHDPATGATLLKASGTPPSISDMDGDQFADAGDRRGAGYWAVGDKKKVIFFPLGAEQNFQVVATLNGQSIDSVTPFGDNRVVVALSDGRLMSIDASNGSATSFATLPTGSACGLGRRDPQRFSVRGDPTGTLFVGNRGCRTVTVYDGSLQPVTTGDELVANPFNLASPDPFFVETLDWQSGQGGDFVDCNGASISAGCQFGARSEQAVMWDVKTVAGGDTTYRMFQFINLVDCRWSGDRPCPIVNCPQADAGGNENACPAKEDQVLDLAQLLIRADQSGAFEEVAFGNGPVPVMAIPAYVRGEECYPSVFNPSDCTDNGYRFQSFFAVTDAVFTGNFFVDYQVDKFRDGTSLDPCVIPPAQSTISAINETANLIVYNSDTFPTINRGGAEGNRGGVIINDACNGRGSAIKWSAQTIGMELYDDGEEAYVGQVQRMMQELKQAKTELLCSAFPDPDGGPALGPLLDPAGVDCSKIQAELDQMEQKLDTCLDSLYYPQSGSSAENCNAFDTKVQNLQSVLSAAAWPNPNVPANFDVLRPNYEGEFRSRLAALVFFLNAYVKNGVPPGGIGAP